MQETRVQSLGWEDPLEEGMAIYSSIPAWRIPWTEEPDELQSMGLQRVRHNWMTNIHTQTNTHTHSCTHAHIYIPVQFSCSVMSDSLWTHGLQHARLPCPSPTPRACSNSCPLSQRCHPTTSSSVIPFSSHLQSFPASGSFQISQFFASGGQSIGASASVHLMNIPSSFPLGLTSLISLLSKGLSRAFSNTTVQSIYYLALSHLYGPTLTSVHDYWK